ncbi:CaiB/BaiF CoA transferase family protein, partial [Chloroflexota bacterium]
MADLGADVIKVEPPRGDPARRTGPFYKDIPDRENSLYWMSYNANKKGMTLNIERKEGQEIFKRLVLDAHFVIESFSPGYMDNLGLGYSALSNINKQIIVISITPFGQTGPYRDYKASDIGCTAASGFMYLVGDRDRAPLRIGLPQSYQHASVHALLGGLIAHHYRMTNGIGQHVDVSIQESVSFLTYDASVYWFLYHSLMERDGSRRLRGSGLMRRNLWRCKDGYVLYVLLTGAHGAKSNRAMVEWMESEGMVASPLKETDFATFDYDKLTQEDLDKLEEPIGKFLLKHSQVELYKGAMKRHILLYPVSTAKTLLEDSQLRSRNYWVKTKHPLLGDEVTYPGSFARFS